MDYLSNRRQEVLTLARKIQSNPDDYPEIMQYTANLYLCLNTERRKHITNLWKHKEIRKLYRESGGYSKLLHERRKAGNVLRYTYPKASDGFHKAKNAMYDKYNWNGISVVEFLAMNNLLECNNIENINKYFRCVNAKRYDDSTVPVAFLRPIRQSVVIEILSFKILKELV